jgi:hypothetical protein
MAETITMQIYFGRMPTNGGGEGIISFLIEIEHMTMFGIGKKSPAFQWRKPKLVKGISTLNLVQAERRALWDVIPAEDQVSTVAQTCVALPERGLALRQGIQAPTIYAIAENYVEIARLEMFRRIFKGSDDVVGRSKFRLIGTGLDCPEFLVGEEFSLIVRCKGGASDEQDFLEPWIVTVIGKYRFFENPAISGVERSQQTQSFPECCDCIASLDHQID